MREPIVLPVKAEVLVWARKSASLPLETAAKAANVAVDRLAGWESGEGTPTIAQLKSLANKYHRPLAVMLLPVPPRDFQALRDFRRVDPSFGSKTPIPPRVAYEIRIAHERREIALEMQEQVETAPEPFVMEAGLEDDPDRVATEVRQFLGVSPSLVSEWVRGGKVFEGWRAAIEARSVLVFVMGGSHGPHVRDVRGFAIPAKMFPVVAVNARDRTNGRTFTLLHEFAHLLLGEGVIENAVAPDASMPPPVKRIERWCNSVAAAILMPREAVAIAAGDKSASAEWSDQELSRAAEALGASREAVLIRMIALGRASARTYLRRKRAFQEEYEALDQPTGASGGPPHHKQMIGRYGRRYARLVLSGYRGKRITLNDAAAFLGVQAKHVPYIEQQAFRTL